MFKSDKVLVYVAGPYTKPDPEQNTEAAMAVAEWIWGLGLFPVLPHLTHFWEQRYHHGYEDWMLLDEALLDRCDAVFRMPGESEGANREVDRAIKLLQIPVFYNPSDLQHFAKTRAQHAHA